MIPSGLAFEVFASVNRGIVLGVSDVAVEVGLGGACVHETARDDDNALPVGDRHRAGLNDGLAGKIALAGTSVQVPFRALWSRATAENAKSTVDKTAPATIVVEYLLMISFQY